MAFVDLEKLFNNVHWTTLFEVIEGNTRVIYNMYIDEISVINAEKGNYQVKTEAAKSR